MDADLQAQVVQDALKESGGDILIDSTYYFKITYIPFFLPIYTTTLMVDGTACKMEIENRYLSSLYFLDSDKYQFL